jgi:hypothetical protein
MRAGFAFRSAAILNLFLAAGHTYGFLSLRPPTPEARAVRAAMDDVHFAIGSHSYSFGAFYVGFGLFVTATFLLLGWLCWALGSLSTTTPRMVPFISWPLVAFYAASAILSLLYFALPPVLFSVVIGLSLAWASLNVRAQA